MLALLLTLACADPPSAAARPAIGNAAATAPVGPNGPNGPGRDGPNGPPSGAIGPPPAGTAGKSSLQAKPYSEAGAAAEAKILAWSTERRPDLLVEAAAALDGSKPALTFDHHLRAWVARLQGDATAQATALAAADPSREAVYRYFFERPEAELMPLLRAHLHAICQIDRRPDCGAAPPIPADYPVFEQVAWASHAANRLQQWVGYTREPTFAELFAVLGVTPGLRVADIGAGEGWFTLPLARAVGPAGRAYATEIDPSYLSFIAYAAEREHLANVEPVLQTPTDVSLPPASVDLVLLCEVYKALTTNAQAKDPAHVAASVTPFLESIEAALVPGGRFVVIDHDAPESEDKAVSMSVIRAQVEAAGFRYVRRDDTFGPMQAVLVFERP